MKPDKAHSLTDKELLKLEKRIAAEYKKAAAEMHGKINAYFQSFAKCDAEQKAKLDAGEITDQYYKQWRLAQIGRGKRMEKLRDQLAERITSANEVSAAYINDTTPGIYSLNRNYSAYTIEKEVGADVGFTLWDEQTVKRLITEQQDLMPYYPPKRAVKRGIDLEWGKKQITAQVTQGILMGESIKHLSDRLQTNIPNMNRDSAIRAARTAVTGAQNAGRMDSYRAAEGMGIKLRKQWMATLDGRTRHAHALLDGQTQEIDKPFESELGEIMFPGDPNATPSNVYNCRCTMIADVDGVDTNDALRRDRAGLLPDMTFSQWENTKRGEGLLAADFYVKKEFEREKRDRKQFAEYKEILGKNAPKSFAKFQDLKYNDPEKWKLYRLDKTRRTSLKNHPELALPGDRKIIPDSKFTGYIFNKDNPNGWAKGVYFERVLGYSSENWEKLQAEIMYAQQRNPAKLRRETEFGVIYEQQMILYGETGNPTNVLVGWIHKPDGSTSMTTAYIKKVKP